MVRDFDHTDLSQPVAVKALVALLKESFETGGPDWDAYNVR